MTVAVSGVDQGVWLVEHRRDMDRGEAVWLETLADFDAHQGWTTDGQLWTVAWLMWRTDMARATAFEKVRIARQLRHRPVIADAFRSGRLSYSATRAITRIEGPDVEVEEALVTLAESGSVTDVERAVRCYERHQDQHRPPVDVDSRRGVRIVRDSDGSGRLEAVLSAVEIEELATVIQAFIDLRATEPHPPASAGESPRGDWSAVPSDLPGDVTADHTADFIAEGPTAGPVGAAPATEVWVGQSPRGDCRDLTAGWPSRRADALMDLARTALAYAGDGHAMGADRYLVHVVCEQGATTLLDGTAIDEATVDQIGCDTSTVTHVVGDDGETLRLGRKTRGWNTAQRRAIMVRDRRRCRFPGCEHRIADIHHQQPWDRGGPTDVDNGLLICEPHHRLLHTGFGSNGDTNHTVTFYRSDGTILGLSAPPTTTAWYSSRQG